MMKSLLLWMALLLAEPASASATSSSARGLASWYGEDHRGRLMANGRKFNPDKFTAASWFYPLGTKVRVTLDYPGHSRRSVLVTITDRGPADRLVKEGRIIDLAHAPFRQLTHPDQGLVEVTVVPVR
jgi:rare lipoprotein A